ncbi:ribonucleotide reductase [Cutibacterium acnes JCM 18918]|nr:ribonucleotide reductase [Cutibacterium acnes JCM 18918]
MIDLVIDQLLDRLKIQSHKLVRNFPFLMGQGVWIDSEELRADDSVAEVLKHGTLSVGFIGLAETLTALIGVHHGESEEAQQLGLRIVGHLQERMDEAAERTGLNFSALATPAEGLSGRFVRMDRQRYGSIPGVTDREYYTNSFHVPVWYHIGAADKIAIELPTTPSPMVAIFPTWSCRGIQPAMSTPSWRSCDTWQPVASDTALSTIPSTGIHSAATPELSMTSVPDAVGLKNRAPSTGSVASLDIWWALWIVSTTPSAPKSETALSTGEDRWDRAGVDR